MRLHLPSFHLSPTFISIHLICGAVKRETRRRFLGALGAGAATLSLPADEGRAKSLAGVSRRDEHDKADWMIHYTVDVAKDGRATISLTLQGSEIPGWVRFRKQRTKDMEVRNGQEALSEGDYSFKWDTSVTKTVEYAVQLGHLKLVNTQMAVLDESVIFRDRELGPVGSWEGGMDALPTEHRLTFDPPTGWSVISPGREVDSDTYDIYPSIRIDNAIRDLFAVGNFSVETKTVGGSEIRATELPSADGPSVSEALSLMAKAQPAIEEFFGEQSTYPKAAVIVPTEVHPGGGFARDNSFVVSDNRPLYDVDSGFSHVIHELAHTWQRFGSPPWQVEGPIGWHPIRTLYEIGEISEAEMRQMLQSRGTKSGSREGDPITLPANGSRHRKGAAVAAALDIDIRARTDGTADIDAFVSRINDQRFDPDYRIDRDEELAALEDVTGVDYTEFFDRFVDGDEYPMAVLADDFSVDSPATVWGSGFQLSAFEVSPSEVRPGDPVTVTVDVTNLGDASGRSTVQLYVDDRAVESRAVNLDPDETTTVEFELSFDDPGRRLIRVNERSATSVTVLDHSAAFEIVGTDLKPESVAPGEQVIVVVDVRNSGKGDGHRELEVMVDSEVVDATAVWVPAGGQESVTFSHQFEAEGSYEITVNDVSVGTVSVRNPEPSPRESPESSARELPGFETLGTLASLGAAGYLSKRWHDETDDQ